MLRAVLISLFLWCSVYSSAQNIESSLLWKISSTSDPSNCAFLFGTIHIIDQNFFYIPDTLEQIISNVDEVCLELKIDDPMEMMLGLLSLGDRLFLKDSKNIFDYLSPSDSILLRENILNLDFPIDLVIRLKPLFISTLIGPKTKGSPALKSYEVELSNLAQGNGKSICGLESFAEQIVIFDNIPLENQVDQLLKALHNETLESSDLDSLTYYYINQDVNKLDHIIEASFNEQSGNLSNALISNRNDKWATIIQDDLAKKKKKLYAVGAGHLGGEKGLINILKQNGISLTPVIFKWKVNGNNEINSQQKTQN